MIVAVADDFTGAAEIGAVGLRYGLKSEVQTEFNADTDAELIVIDTDTRSSEPEVAADTVEAVSAAVAQHRPELLFKKVDSVLRGPVLAELGAIMSATGVARVLLVPANPALGRTIKNGCYFICGRSVHCTDFSLDPEHPCLSSDVLAMLGYEREIKAVVASVGSDLRQYGVSIGEAESDADLNYWASRLDENIIPAGAAGFFSAILESTGMVASKSSNNPHQQDTVSLFACGSRSQSSLLRIAAAEVEGMPVVRMPQELVDSDEGREFLIEFWASTAAMSLKRDGRAVLAVGHQVSSRFSPRALRERMAWGVRETLCKIKVDRLCIEGGATASAIVRRMGWKRLEVMGEESAGVVAMRVIGADAPLVVTKPGSYGWRM